MAVTAPKKGNIFEVTKEDDYYYFELIANNGQLLFTSRPYASLKNCLGGIDTFRKNIAEAETMPVKRDKNKNYRWMFVKGTIVMEGIAYSTEKSAASNAESVKKFAASATVVDNSK